MNANDTAKIIPTPTLGEGIIAKCVAAGLSWRLTSLDDRYFSRLAIVYVRQPNPLAGRQSCRITGTATSFGRTRGGPRMV